MDDWQLLQDYAKGGSEKAFRALVERYLGLVYTAAQRQANDPQLAEEVTQAVFILLARKAGSLRREVLLPGWLFRTTRFVASRAVRSERRRRQHEQEAAAMHQLDLETASSKLSPLLDEALFRLGERDRNAVLLRFAQEQSLREVGRQLGLSEEAAKKRVSRAVERLRSFFARRGYPVSLAILASVFSHHLAQGAPADLVARVAAKAVAAGAGGASTLPLLVRETLGAWLRTKWIIAGISTVLLFGLFELGVLVGPKARTTNHAISQSNNPQQPTIAASAKGGIAAANFRQGVIHFHVIAKETGEPLAGAQIAVNTVTDGEWKQRFDLSTDDQGTAIVPYLPTTTRLDVGVVAWGWAARFATWFTDLDGAIPTDYTLRVERVRHSMGGWLRDQKGHPVANAEVVMEFSSTDMAQEENPRERPGFVVPRVVATSDKDGRWSCAVVDPSARRIPGLLARHPAFAPAQIAPASWAGDGSEAQSQTNLVWEGKQVTMMSRALKLIGRVTNQEGSPLAGAHIEHEPSAFESLLTESDAEGWFVFEGLAVGDFDFYVSAPGFAQDYRKISVHDGMTPVEVRLKAGAVLRLRLVDENDAPVVGGTAAVTGPGGIYLPGATMSWSAASGPDGRVTWTSAPIGQMLNLCVSKHPDFSLWRQTLKADGEEHVIHLHRAIEVTGSVTDARTGELVRKLKAFPGYGDGENSWYRGETRHSTNGAFRVHFNETLGFPFRVRVEAVGYVPFVSEPLDSTSSTVLDVALQPVDPLQTVRGVVWRTDGQPAAGAEVALLGPEHGASLGRGRFAQRSSADQLILNADAMGRFAFPYPEPHTALVIAVCSNGIARAPVIDPRQPMEIRLQSWGRIEGTIDSSAQKRPVAYVAVDDLSGRESEGRLRLDSQVFYSKPQEDGRFAFEFVPPGFLCVWLITVLDDPPVQPFHHPTWVQVEPGTTAQVVVAETGFRVKGRFIIPERGDNHKPRFAVLDSDWPFASPKPPCGPKAKPWDGSFFELGRLVIAPDGHFESLNPIVPGAYRLLGSIQGVRLDQEIQVPNPAADDFPGLDEPLPNQDPPILDLGNIPIPQE